jgi:hypothetical protein
MPQPVKALRGKAISSVSCGAGGGAHRRPAGTFASHRRGGIDGGLCKLWMPRWFHPSRLHLLRFPSCNARLSSEQNKCHCAPSLAPPPEYSIAVSHETRQVYSWGWGERLQGMAGDGKEGGEA